MTKKPICRDPNSWLQSAHQVKYNPIRSSPQSYHYSRKNESTKLHLEPSVESYSQKKPCRFCGGTGSYPNEAAVSRKNNCRVHEPTKVSFSTKEKFGMDFFSVLDFIIIVLLLKIVLFLIQRIFMLSFTLAFFTNCFVFFLKIPKFCVFVQIYKKYKNVS